MNSLLRFVLAMIIAVTVAACGDRNSGSSASASSGSENASKASGSSQAPESSAEERNSSKKDPNAQYRELVEETITPMVLNGKLTSFVSNGPVTIKNVQRGESEGIGFERIRFEQVFTFEKDAAINIGGSNILVFDLKPYIKKRIHGDGEEDCRPTLKGTKLSITGTLRREETTTGWMFNEEKTKWSFVKSEFHKDRKSRLPDTQSSYLAELFGSSRIISGSIPTYKPAILSDYGGVEFQVIGANGLYGGIGLASHMKDLVFTAREGEGIVTESRFIASDDEAKPALGYTDRLRLTHLQASGRGGTVYGIRADAQNNLYGIYLGTSRSFGMLSKQTYNHEIVLEGESTLRVNVGIMYDTLNGFSEPSPMWQFRGGESELSDFTGYATGVAATAEPPLHFVSGVALDHKNGQDAAYIQARVPGGNYRLSLLGGTFISATPGGIAITGAYDVAADGRLLVTYEEGGESGVGIYHIISKKLEKLPEKLGNVRQIELGPRGRIITETGYIRFPSGDTKHVRECTSGSFPENITEVRLHDMLSDKDVIIGGVSVDQKPENFPLKLEAE